jgi:transposase
VDTIPVTGRADLTDEQWAVLEPLLPKGKKPGRPPKWTRRQLIDGIRWRTRAGTPWRDVPERYGPWQSVYGLFRRWQRDGNLEADPDRVASPRRRGRVDHVGRQCRFDDRPGAPACGGCAEKGDLQKEPPGGVAVEPADHALGRSRGGLTTKLHLGCEQGQKPLSLVVTAGQRGDSPQFATVLEGIRIPRVGGGRPRTRPDRALADKAYSSKANRAYLRRRGSRRPSRSRMIRPRTGARRGRRAAGRRPSTLSSTGSGTRSSAVSTGSNATGPWPLASTSSPYATRPPFTSRQSTSGSDPERGLARLSP